MSKLTERLRSVGIINQWDFAGHGNVYIAYSPGTSGRASSSPKWQVIRPGFKTDRDSAWYDYGNKTFLVYGAGSHQDLKKSQLQEAQRWASERYGITTWAKTPYGTWMDADFVKQRLAELAKQMEAL